VGVLRPGVLPSAARRCWPNIPLISVTRQYLNRLGAVPDHRQTRINAGLKRTAFPWMRVTTAAFCLLFCCRAFLAQQASTQPANPKSKPHKKKPRQGLLARVPTLGVVDAPSAPPLGAEGKLRLAATEFINPFVIAEDAVKAQYYRGLSPQKKIGHGASGYSKQFGAAYLDTVSSSMFSSFIYPTLLHQDPRYFRKGEGSFRGRLIYSLSRVIVGRGDSGKTEFNWSQVLGSASATALSSTYYPSGERRGGAIGANIGWSLLGDEGTDVFNEFWPDVSYWLSRKRGGRDAGSAQH
jgi:hypothetical protein